MVKWTSCSSIRLDCAAKRALLLAYARPPGCYCSAGLAQREEQVVI
jgi:hypothetical protein